MNVVPFPNANGGFRFICTGCDAEVLTPIHDGFPVCAVCRWLDERPQIPADVRDRIRGKP